MANGAGTLPRTGVEPATLTELPVRRRERPGLAARLSSSRVKLAEWAKPKVERAVAWRIAVPGLAGVGLISAGLALRFGVWAGLIVAGLFLLRLDSRIR